ncbi:MAG: magnesium transporter [Deltaproteobacteria bacterium]|nr:magnesium transporter [Deltaproteobacteria bacterium]MBW2017243.1 magnesium transporter [Deltaproteobacteria bacterium]MBW2129679.1 magnesium transporter [Deltaproteobacteria bacterium]MBW2304767.1 magnesium transporter [Deltaproteobacteria bacterium]
MKNPLLIPEIRELLAKKDIHALREFCSDSHPGVIADFLSGLTMTEIRDILLLVEPTVRVDIFSHLDSEIQLAVIELMTQEEAAVMISKMAHDERVDLLKQLPEERLENLLPAVAKAEREDIRNLFSYPEGTAGSVMTSDYATLSPEWTAQEAINRLRLEAPDTETIYYTYVVDRDRRLIGFVSLKDLILARPERLVKDIMYTDVIYARTDDDQEEAARKIQKYDLIALPVINGNDNLVGIITHDDAMDIITQEHTEDLEKFMAIGGAHETGVYLRTSAWEHFRNRCGWVVVLALFGLISGWIVQSFEELLIQFTILATFMPMLADTGGNTGSQSATLVIRALALKEITPGNVLGILFKEMKVSILLAILLASLAFARVIFFTNSGGLPLGHSLVDVGTAIAAALGIQVITATLMGALLPLGADKAGFDPAVVASPALTTLVDITGLFIYFMTVKLMLGI